MLGDRLDDPTSLGNVVRQRLLAIDVLARLRGQDAGDRVPMVRRGNHDGVDVFAFDDLAEVRIRVAALVLGLLVGPVTFLDNLFGVVHSLGNDIAHGHDLDILHAEKTAQVSPAHRADADEAQREPIVRGDLLRLLGKERAGSQKERSRGTGLKKLPAGESQVHGKSRLRGGCVEKE